MPDFTGAPDTIRTCDLCLRRATVTLRRQSRIVLSVARSGCCELPAVVHRDVVAYAETLGRIAGEAAPSDPAKPVPPMLQRLMVAGSAGRREDSYCPSVGKADIINADRKATFTTMSPSNPRLPRGATHPSTITLVIGRIGALAAPLPFVGDQPILEIVEPRCCPRYECLINPHRASPLARSWQREAQAQRIAVDVRQGPPTCQSRQLGLHDKHVWRFAPLECDAYGIFATEGCRPVAIIPN
jgi:Protein of unknown function (DUF2274)